MSHSGYWKHVGTVLGGALGAQAMPLLAAPLITRMCTPSELGAFAVWLGVVAVSAIAATLRLETAMILDHEAEQQRTCFSVVFHTATVTAVLVSLCALAAHAFGLPALHDQSWGALAVVGAATWLTAYTQTTLAYATSHKQFGKAARAKIIGAATIAATQLLLLWLGVGEAGLLAGQLVGLAAGLLAATVLLHPPRPRIGLRLDGAARAYLLRHQKFWRYSLPSNLLNAFVSQMPLFLIGLRHGVLAAGLYALTQRVLAAPVSLLAASVLEVFKRESVHEFQTLGHCTRAYRYTFKALLMLGLGPALVLLLFSPDLFAWVFGASWRPAGELAQILAPLCFLNFIASPLSYVFFVAGKQKVDLVWQVTLFLMTLCAFLAPGSLRDNVLWYTIGYSLLYLVYLHMSYQISQNRLAAA
ncbi:lipopolysaccharide biosynthesis protein [uncultured Massilia sp.]|uniref:lipopolysaccharide biosynthesis protein n=1 Tax=uncultured Massilia sp. TaxID=169973 RepID=UPI0025F7DF0B|nr:oligosaccharide flippase family protein [uncultured Massilia sp.]